MMAACAATDVCLCPLDIMLWLDLSPDELAALMAANKPPEWTNSDWYSGGGGGASAVHTSLSCMCHACMHPADKLE